MITALKAENFRNFQRLSLSFDSVVTVLTGSNGQGKSNILEGIFFLGMLRSFRTSQWKDLRKIGSSGFSLAATISVPKQNWKTELQVEYAKKRSLKVDGFPVHRSSDFIRKLNTVVFSPEDIMIVNGSSSCRRRFFDMLISGMDSGYFSYLQNYQYALDTRNRMLKMRETDSALFSSYEKIIAENGSRIVDLRKNFALLVAEKTEEFLQTVKKDTIQFQIEYRFGQGTADPEIFLHRLESERNRDFERGFTQIGPQQDDFEFNYNGKLLRTYGSNGQCRIVSLCLKMAQLELFHETIGHRGSVIALVDDVTGELDQMTRQAFLHVVGKVDQAFFTFTEPPEGMFFEKSAQFLVREGKVS